MFCQMHCVFTVEETLEFGFKRSICSMFANTKAVIRCVDNTTLFFAATFLEAHRPMHGQSLDGEWFVLVAI